MTSHSGKYCLLSLFVDSVSKAPQPHTPAKTKTVIYIAKVEQRWP